MKTCLINPPSLLPNNWKGNFEVFPPLGLAYIAAVLEENNYDVSIIDGIGEKWWQINKLNGNKKYLGMSYKEIVKKVCKLNPDIVGVTAVTSQKRSAFKVAEEIKKVNDDVIIILGGPHASICPLECLSNPFVDFVIIGEGEYTMLDLLKNKLKNLKRIKGLGYKANRKLVLNDRREPIKNLDELPFPARHLLPMKKYFDAARFAQASRGKTKRWTSMITSRGCPFNCVFCSVNITMSRIWRPRSPENVVNEIEHLVDNYKINQISFEDDNMTLNKERVARICDLIVERGIDIEWDTPNGIRADTLDKRLLIKMKNSGCRRICVAPESGDQFVVDNIIGKRLNLKKVEEVVRLCKKIGIRVDAFFVIGLVGETKNQINRTVEFARKLKKLGLTSYVFSIATPFYGTRLYEQAKSLGYLLKDGEDLEEGFLNFEGLIKTPEFSPEELYSIHDQMMKEQLPSLMRLLLNNPMHSIRYIYTRFIRNPQYMIKYFLKW